MRKGKGVFRPRTWVREDRISSLAKEKALASLKLPLGAEKSARSETDVADTTADGWGRVGAFSRTGVLGETSTLEEADDEDEDGVGGRVTAAARAAIIAAIPSASPPTLTPLYSHSPIYLPRPVTPRKIPGHRSMLCPLAALDHLCGETEILWPQMR